MKFSRIALLTGATLAVGQPHVHRHAARHASPVEQKRDIVYLPGPVETVYEFDGKFISYSEVEAGLKSGKYVLLGESISTVIPAPTSTSTTPSSTPIATPSSTSEAAQFFQNASSSSSSVAPTPTYVAPTTSAAPITTSSSAPAASSSSSNPSGDVNANFPSGSIPCSTFPSEYGAVYVDWLGLEGWAGVQKVPDFDFGISSVISNIETGISGSGGCSKNSFCSYACPAGHQKSQWPSAQGNTGQSIGGLYCNSNGMLELSRPSVSQICIPGTGDVQVTNNLSKNVAICRTDYPGTESETIPLNTEPGQTYELTCPDASNYYTWEGSATSAQYYINPSGTSVGDACQWGSAGSNVGNWAPVNCGVGKGTDGVTYISLFQNAPTNPTGILDFNIKITGGVSGDCSYSGGKFYNNGVESSTGCTVAVTGVATFDFS